ncbi:MAG: hypothetical protein OXR66_03220 [Candidatus Woesearchaeota archaeon]|nr:hypothetical protein [Candidatus Woesearchaeota archaeon]
MVHLPAGIAGWAVFVSGLVLIAYRVRGIDAPRAWVEWMERQFVYERNLRIIGGCLLLATLVVWWLGSGEGTIGTIFTYCMLLFCIAGFGLLLTQNHLRLLFVATGEATDNMIKYVSIGFVVVGLLLALAPWFL